jgi:hypothetical protein
MYVSFYPPSKEKVGPIAQLRRLWGKNLNRKRRAFVRSCLWYWAEQEGPLDRNFPKVIDKTVQRAEA